MSNLLNAEKVNNIFTECLFTDEEDKTQYVEASGVMLRVGFHPGRLAKNEDVINEMINQLPDNFKKTGGGGWSFLNACLDSSGSQWADTHQSVDQLVCLGLATKKIEFQMPRTYWGMFPGGMPYFLIN